MENSSYDRIVIESLKTLCKDNECCKNECKRFLSFETFSKADIKDVLSSLSKLLLLPDCTLHVASCFPQMVLEILSIAMDMNVKVKGKDAIQTHRQMCVTLGKLVRSHPDAVRFSLQFFEKNPSPFDKFSDEGVSCPKKRKMALAARVKITDLDIVLSCYNFLQVACEHFRQLWDWSVFMELYLGHKDNQVCWVACQCVAWVTGMSDVERQEFISHHLSEETVGKCMLVFDEQQEEERRKSVPRVGTCANTELSPECKVTSESVITISGIQLPVYNPKLQKNSGCLVPVPSTSCNLHSLALAVASGRAICLQGPVGCGKTALVEHLAHLTGRTVSPHFIKVQLGDQTDSKMLLGTYRCTDIPGEFVWQPGVLTQAVMGGHWLLLEDIDTAAMDVASVLASLLETGTLTVPGYRDSVKVSPGFQLFVTQRLLTGVSGFQRQISGASSLLEKLWLVINVEPLSKSELVQIIQTMFPALSTVAQRIVKVFLLFSVGKHGSGLNAVEDLEKDDDANLLSIAKTSGRLISTRDLIKWCARAVEGFDGKSQESTLKIYQDAIDIFCCSITDEDTRVQLAAAIGSCLGIIRTKAEYFCKMHKPNISLTALNVIAGRAVLPKLVKDVARLGSGCRSSFSHTRQAACLLERVARCVSRKEPVLLVGETGTGKTTVVQYLAECTHNRLIVINMNQQSDSADLLGGYKPVDLKFVAAPVREEFEKLFRDYFSVSHNAKFLENIAICFNSRRWTTLLRLMKQSYNAALRRLAESPDEKRRSTWQHFGNQLLKLESQVNAQSALAFAFIEGSLVKALQEGYWVLLDEINLASAETLQCLSGLLEGSAGSLYLIERGDSEPIRRHPDFQLFACMNPATDVGKKDLPAGLRNRFTEFFVDELTEHSELVLLVGRYLQDLNLPDAKLEKIVKFYLNIRNEASISLADGTGHKPHYSLRTLCRALSVAARNPCSSSQRSLFEAMCLSFLTQLNHTSHPAVMLMIAKAILGASSCQSVLKQPIPPPQGSSEKYVSFEGYWVLQGSVEPKIPEKYILTPSVRRNLHDLVRVVSIGHHPVLLQGETSVGKTSLITYLAQTSGNHCVRINNHEHTDLQEYVGSYCADDNGHLVFREGVLVEAMRKGHWIILDELNLAPTDVLEALNRVLDDNRELFIPETQETVKADPRFMLFATQNPPGLYGGRKMLSRAFRNRFVELHFAEIPPAELETIMQKRCDMPPSYCKKLVAVMTELQIHRRESAAFAGKQGFMTLRDLFRWGERYRLANQVTGKFYDWDQHLADEGYLVLAGRVRKEEECKVIQEALKKHIKRTVSPECLFTLNDKTSPVTRDILEKLVSKPVPGFEHIVWTFNMRRLAVLVGKAFMFQEPVLLVGETGCGKTTICQLLAAIQNQVLYSVNCHMHTESSDFLGGLRPVREHGTAEGPQKLFEWVDGPLITSMQTGNMFLADEISLADDSVLERLNSLLEPERTLLLAEKGTDGQGTDHLDSSCVVMAQEPFRFIGTMNPGGDYGKKELSPALRNRFTEIWCLGCTQRADLLAVIEHNIRPGLSLGNQEDGTSGIGNCMLDFIQWFKSIDVGKRFPVSIRDILSWVNFVNVSTEGTSQLDVGWAYVHGACLTFLDSFGSGITNVDSAATLKTLKKMALKFLMDQMKLGSDSSFMEVKVVVTEDQFGIHPFYIARGKIHPVSNNFSFDAPTTGLNALRVMRALQLNKPILLEGSPGVGKTSLVAALAKASSHRLVRINLSDQTDVSDLFGADLPVEGGEGGQFAWRDGPFLQALKAGDWILLDELNLATQSVLEGLNACLDHRGEIFIPELGRTFHVQPGRTHLFGAQNPLKQGGARRGLPQSFLNRFTQVYVEALSDADLELILKLLYPTLPHDLVARMIQFNARLVRETGELRLWGHRGAPWELNLRDLCRWCQALTEERTVYDSGSDDSEDIDVMNEATSASGSTFNPGRFVGLIYIDRMRTLEDKEKVKEIYCEEFGDDYPLCCDFPRVHVARDVVFVGDVALPRSGGDRESDKPQSVPPPCVCPPEAQLLLLRKQFPTLQSLAKCVNMNWLAILVGPSASGKTSAVRLLSQLAGRELKTLSINSAMDTTEILGGFEQADYNRHLEEAASRIERLLLVTVRSRLVSGGNASEPRDLLRRFELFRKLAKKDVENLAEESQLFYQRMETLLEILGALPSAGLPSNLLPELKNVEQKVTALRDRLKKEDALNAGGKFEWVDSILVKCLQEGCWLLLDGVNLCSPAVLDRLNALLEPDGVLTIGERGVDSSGELVTIKPHPNFRLFLAMDPKHGEISRAMRNRGVEICLLKEENQNKLDIAALMANMGLSCYEEQQALLAVHQAMSDVWQDLDEPGISHLLHAAFLISQQTSRGHGPYEAFLSSCRDVYVKNHSRSLTGSTAGNSTVKQKLYQTLTETLSEHREKLDNQNNRECLENCLPMYDSTIKSAKLQENSVFATLKQEGGLLVSVLDALVLSKPVEGGNISLMSPNTEFLNRLLVVEDKENLLEPNVKLIEILPYLLLIYFERSTVNDIQLRHEWLVKHVKKCIAKSLVNKIDLKDCLSFVLKMSSSLKDTLLKSLSSSVTVSSYLQQVCASRDLPWDLRWLPEILASNFSPTDSETLEYVGVANTVSLLCHFTFLKKVEEISKLDQGDMPVQIKHRAVTVLEYSSAVNEGKLSDDVTSHPLVVLFAPFLKQLDAQIEMLLESDSTLVDHEKWEELLPALAWRFRFGEQGSVRLIEETGKKSRSLDLAIDTLSVHYKWICKHLLPRLQDLVEQDATHQNSVCTKKLLSTVDNINTSIASSISPFLTVGKRVRRFMGQPLPFPTLELGTSTEQVHRLSACLQVWPDLDPAHGKKQSLRVLFLLSSQGEKARGDLMAAMGLLKSGSIKALKEAQLLIDHVEEQLRSADLLMDAAATDGTTLTETAISKENLKDCAKVKLWPFKELLALALSVAFMREVFQKTVSESDIVVVEDVNVDAADTRKPTSIIARQLLAVLEDAASVPPVLASLVREHSVNAPSSKQSILELLTWHLRHNALSPARSFSQRWLTWNAAEDDEAATDSVSEFMNFMESSEDSFPLHCPIMTELVTGLVLKESSGGGSSAIDLVATTSLGSQQVSRHILRSLQELLWRNIASLTSSQLDYKVNDCECALAVFQYLLQGLQEALSDVVVPGREGMTISIMEELVSKLHTRISEMEDFSVVEVNHFIEALRKLAAVVDSLQKGKGTDQEILMWTGELWTLLGYVQITLFSKFGTYDPVEKKALKLQYATEEHKDVARALYAHELQACLMGQSLDSYSDCNLHPLILLHQKRLGWLTNKKMILAKNVAFRPSDRPYFQEMKKEVRHYSGSLGSSEVILGHHRRLMTACQDLIVYLNQSERDKQREQTLARAAGEVLREERSWRQSQTIFSERLSKTFGAWYPDMVIPFLSAIHQLCHGTSLLASVLNKLLLQLKLQSSEPMVFNLVRFPILGAGQESIMHLVETCGNPALIELMERILMGDNKDLCLRQESYRLMQSSLQELRNHTILQGVWDTNVWHRFTILLSQLVTAWRQQEDERIAREAEKDNLFVTKGGTRCKTLSEEEEAALEMEKLFPTTVDEDFGDMQQQPTLDSAPADPQMELEEAAVGLITADDVHKICQLHLELATYYSRCGWLAPINVGIQPDFVSPLLLRYRTFRLVLQTVARGMNSTLDKRLAASLVLLTSLALNEGKSSEMTVDLSLPGSPSRHSKSVSTKKTTDFYRDTNAGEVRQCSPLLGSVRQRVQQLLDQWPDHPTLTQIMKILERILGFPITSPVARFLTGLELLLTKMQEWEENAHSGVSLASHMATVTHQIIAWRKLELQCWKDCLNNAALRAKTNASRWWFHIYSLVEAFTKRNASKEPPMTVKDLIHSLQRFMEESVLGEFDARLEILYGFHCHTVHMEPSSRRDELMSILWNLHGYYSQFSDGVNAKIRELRLPIEKKLKDFVKIARWNDINYWAVKAAVEKTRKTLYKHVKEFENVLKQPAVGALTNPKAENSNTEVSEGLWDRPQRHQPRQYHLMLDPLHFVASSRLKRFIVGDGDKDYKDFVLLARAGSLFSRACKLSKETILASSYPRLLQTVDSFITEIIETSIQLKNLEVSKELTKEKQRSQAKSFLQQKRKALADLFRTLQQMGLSYRTGIVLWDAEDNSVTNFLLKPMDLKAAFQYLKNRRPDGQLLNVWDGCETYFLRSVARLALLNTALQNPSKDLGPPAIERCRGFAAHLMIVCREQKRKLAESSQLLCSLRCLVTQLSAMEETDDILPRQSELQHSLKCLKERLVTSIVCLEQFRIFLQACPSVAFSDEETILLEIMDGSRLAPMITATKDDEVWKSAVTKVKNLISGITKLRAVIAKSETNIPFVHPVQSERNAVETRPKLDTNIPITSYQYDLITEGFDQVEKYADELKDLQMMFELPHNVDTVDCHSLNPMVESIHWLECTIRQEVSEFRERNALFIKSVKRCSETVDFPEANEEISEEPSDLLVSDTTEMEAEESKQLPEATDQDKHVAEFNNKCEKLMKNVLIAIQNMYKKYTLIAEKHEDVKSSELEPKEAVENIPEENQPTTDESRKKTTDEEEEEDFDKIEDGHIKEKIVENIAADLDVLKMKVINSQLQNLIHDLVSILDTNNAAENGNSCKRLLLRCIPCLDQFVLLSQFFVTQQVAAYRVSCKMLSVLLSVFLDLAEKGFCVPPELAEGAEGDQMEGTQGGMGLGEGEGEKDVSETIESEDQLEDARPQGEERKEEDRDCKEEEKGIETSEDFGGKVQDLEKNEGDEEESEQSGDEEEPDKEMGETGEGADTLDQQIWGSDSEGEGSDEGEEEEEKKQESGSGEKTGEKELGAKDENDKYGPEDENEEGDSKQEKQKKDIDEMKEPEVDEDHVDPYHGKQQPLPEPEPLELPEDLQLDEGDAKDGDEDGENPFDIDAMKEKKPPEGDGEGEEEQPTEDKEESKKDAEPDSSDEEEEEGGNETEAPGVKDPDDDEKMETEGPEENKDEAAGGGKDEEKDGLEPKEAEQEDREQLDAMASDDKPSEEPAEAAPDMKGGSKDKVAPTPDQGPNEVDDDMGSEGGDEAQGVGQAETQEDKTGHRGQLPTQRDSLPSQTSQPEPEQQLEKRRRPGDTDSNRTLGDVSEPVKKKLKTVDLSKKDGQGEEEMEEDGENEKETHPDKDVNAELYQHIKDAKESSDNQTLDAATKEQAEKQPVPKLDEEPAEEPSPDEEMKLQKDEPPSPEKQDISEQKAEKVPGKKKNKDSEEKGVGEVDPDGELETQVEVEGESVPTLGAARGSETTYHTSHEKMMTNTLHLEDPDQDPVAVRNELEKQLALWAQPPPDDEAAKAWESFLAITSGLARDLSEQLRLVLEPSQASRLRGDYRTGRRINMRKVIPYIASQFRKDKIWLRRTKPSKRDYQIVLAIDDSASMADNHSKELAFESLALVSRALTLLESGELSVVSFGEMVKVLHQLGDPFTEQSGAKLLQQISFAQNGTRVAQLVEFVTTMFSMNKSRTSHSNELAQLLVIVSDGRGVFNESPNKVKLAIRQAREAHIFMVFIIVDNPENPSSILDIRTPIFKEGKLQCLKPYLDSFPFPFYLILRDINALPGVLSDALRQWFELVTNMDSY